jgi:hypothetical protein
VRWLVAAVALALWPATAGAQLPTIVQDDAQLLHRSDEQTRESLRTLKELGVDVVRVTAGWSVLTRDADASIAPPGFDAADPAAYDQRRFRSLDRVVRMADELGLEVMLDLAFWAPRWATTAAAPARARENIDAAEYARFAVAIARRYAGGWEPPARVGPDGRPAPTADDGVLAALFGGVFGRASAGTGPLPRVSRFTLWNEPNHPAFLRPQWEGRGERRHAQSADVYRRMVQAAYPAVKAVQPDAQVLVGGTAAQSSGGKGVGPVTFLRRLACVDERLEPITDDDCAAFTPVPGDGWAHHPYALRTLPGAPAAEPDHAPIGDLDGLIGTLGRLVAAGRIAPAMGDLWITELGYESNPADPELPFSVGDQAAFLPWTERLAHRHPQVRSFAQFLLRDLPPSASVQTTSARRAQGQWHSGLLFADGRPKLAFEAFRGGIDLRRAGGRLIAWGRLRPLAAGATTDAVLEVRRAGARRWRRAAAFRTGPLLERAVAAPRGARVRLRWRDGDAWRTSPSVAVPR